MMKTVAAHKSENRMSLSALAACMAPLLLRPLLAGDCEFEDNFNMGGDGSLQLLKAAAAANHAQAIVIIMLEEYERIFDEELSQDGSISSEGYTETEEDDIEDDESTDNDNLEDDGYHDVDDGLNAESEDDLEHSSRSSRSSHSSRSSSGTHSGSRSYLGSDQSDNEEEDHSSDSSSHGDAEDLEAIAAPSSTLYATTVQDVGQKPSPTDIPLTQEAGGQKHGLMQNENSNSAALPNNRVNNSIGDVHTSIAIQKSASHAVRGNSAKFRNSTFSMRRSTKWEHTSARKDLPRKSVDCSTDDEIAIQKLEATQSELGSKVTEEVKGNAILQESLERREDALHERRLALEKDILKSGPLFLSSKGIGWTSWKKRWFVLTHTSLVFYRSDPNAPPQKGCEANPTLCSIDLTSSGSVVVKPDKKLLTVFFPDGRGGRTFTLKGETSEELQEWKTALENALAQAPSAAVATGQSEILRNEIADSFEASLEQRKDKKHVSTVIGRPVLLALEEVDGSPSFLEKALRFIEEYGIRVEGVLRQSADVEEVERREQEYEQGKIEFSSDEDAHVIGDCIKHVLREMPSSPVPASCCTALVEAYRIDRGNRINAIRAAISETFPEPNLRLLQRCLKMMKTVAAHRSENRMSLSALAACMAPLLLRPLLAGDCEFEDNFNMGGDGSLQLLKAAAAANHAQAIVIIMLEEYERIFDEELSQDGSFSSDVYTETEEDDIEDDESTDNDILEDHGYHDVDNVLDADNEDDLERSSHSSHSSSGTLSGSGSYLGSDQSDNEEEDHSSDSSSHGDAEDLVGIKATSSTMDATTSVQDNRQKPSPTDILLTQEAAGGQKNGLMQNEISNSSALPNNRVNNSTGGVHTSISMQKSASHAVRGISAKLRNSTASMRRSTKWGHTSARKNVPLKAVGCSTDEIAIQKLEATKSELESKVTEEVKGNAILKENLERRKDALRERRLALEKDVEVLQEQLQKERDFKASLESGLMNMRPGHVSNMSAMDSKTRADLEEINLAEADIINLTQKAADLRGQLSHLQPSDPPLCISCKQQLDGKENRKDLEKIVDSGLLQQNEYSLTTDNSTSGASHESHRPQAKDLIPSIDKNLSQKLLRGDEALSVTSDSSSKKSTSKDENPKSAAEMDTEYSKAQSQNSPTLADAQTSQKLPRQTTRSRTKFNDTSSAEEPISLTRNFASKRSSFRADKQELQDSPTLSNKQLSQRQQLSTASVKSTGHSIDTTALGRNASSKKSFKPEDAATSSSTTSSSSALTRLTNRLNFLKERRVQLANELQNLDANANRTSGPEQPPKTDAR